MDMKVFKFSQARQSLATVLDIARNEQVLIQRRGGDTFIITYKSNPKSPFDVPGIKTKAKTKDILLAIKDSRSGGNDPSVDEIGGGSI